MQDERRELRPPQRVAPDEVAEACSEQSSFRDRTPESRGRLAVQLRHAYQRGDLRVRQTARALEAREETPHDLIVGDPGSLAPRPPRDPAERGAEVASQASEVGEPHDFDDRRIAKEDPGDRPITLDHDDDRDTVLPHDLDLGPDAE